MAIGAVITEIFRLKINIYSFVKNKKYKYLYHIIQELFISMCIFLPYENI